MQNLFMFVDDDDVFQTIVAHVCRRMEGPAKPLRAADGVEGLSLIERLVESPDDLPNVLFVDINMPRLDGFGFLEGLDALRRRHPVLASVKPVAMLTSSDQDRDRERAHRLGAHDYLVKPAGLADLSKVLSRFVA